MEKRQRVVLFDANIDNASAPLALMAITALLDLEKYDVRIITKRGYPRYESEILQLCEGALCFGVTFILGANIRHALDMAAKVKARHPALPVIAGGWGPTSVPDLAIQEACFDYLCRGQGERTFPEFLSALETGASMAGILGLSYREGGAVRHNPPRKMEDINHFPDYSLDLIDWEKHLTATPESNRAVAVMTSMGCPWHCGFCCENIFSGRRWYGLAPERVVGFLKKLRGKVAFDSLYVADSNYFVNEARVQGISRLLAESGLNLAYSNVDARANDLIRYQEETWEALKASGLKGVLTGLESVNNETLKLMEKGCTVDQYEQMIRLCAKHGVCSILSCALGWNAEEYAKKTAPVAFEQEFGEMVAFFKKVFFTMTRNFKMTLFCYVPLPATPLYPTALAHGFVNPDRLEGWSHFELMEYFPPWMEGITPRQKRRLRVFRYIGYLLGANYFGYTRQLPLPLRLAANALLWPSMALAKLRVRFSFYDLPLDMLVMRGVEESFRKVNKLVRMVNLSS